jgi:hypothetical protein
VLSLAAPGPAAAYRCDEAPPVSVPYPELPSRSLYAAPDGAECRVPDNDRTDPIRRTRKSGSMSGLTVFVLAVAAALLIPIGARGIPSSIDPYNDDRPL